MTKHEASPGRVEYWYTVLNGSKHALRALLVGYDEHYGRPMLHGEPYNWDGDNVPATSFRSPPGWRFTVMPTEEDPLLYIVWEVTEHGSDIRAGDSLGGFMVLLRDEDPAYGVGGLWQAYLRGETPLYGALR